MKPLMKPIDTPDQVFHDGDPSTGELGTICSAEWLNNTQASIRDIQAECIAILRANGVEPDETKRDQLWEAIRTAIKRHVPAASLAESGIVQLSGSVTSDSESVAATSKAVKIAMDNANARLAKDRNLADLTNVQLARQSLQLGDSATRNLGTTPGTVAAGNDARIIGAMQKNQNGADIPNKPAFVQNLGLTETVNRALNAVQKTGDTMTGNLFLRNDARVHFAIVDEDGNVRMWLYKDKGGDGVRINNGYDGGGEFVFNKNGEFYSPSHLHAGAATFGNNGDVYGSAWGNTWLTSWITNQLNMRATTGWVNQNFITRVMRGAPVNPGKVNEYGPAEAPAGCVVTSVRHDPTTAYGIYFTYRPLSVFINGGWRVIEG
ncbi:hypothetical protein F8W75_02985 [Salmonella enterica]|nr:hypothetical protein [Salmonella enterica]